MQLVLGDCLAIALLEAKGFTAHEFKTFHPGGSLGASLKYVADVMHKGDRLPLARDTEPMSGALVTMTQKSFGCLGIVDAKGKLIGIVTDGDLRRHMGADLVRARTADIMTRRPKTATAEDAGLGRARADQRLAHHRAVRRREGQAGRHRAHSRSLRACLRAGIVSGLDRSTTSTVPLTPATLTRVPAAASTPSAAQTVSPARTAPRPPDSIGSITVTNWPTSSAPRRLRSARRSSARRAAPRSSR